MRHATPAAVAALILGAAMQPVFAQSTVAPQHPGDPGYDVLLQAATEPVRNAFGNTVHVDVERLDRLGRWAFLQGTLRGTDGARPDYAGTAFAERAGQGGMSDVYVALLQAPADADASPAGADTEAVPSTDRDAAGTAPDPAHPSDRAADIEWALVDHAIGPSDVAWLTWPERHAAPRQLFGF